MAFGAELFHKIVQQIPAEDRLGQLHFSRVGGYLFKSRSASRALICTPLSKELF